jgi:hypothetical protein
VDLPETSHVNYLVIKTYKLPEQTGSYTPNSTREEHGSSRLGYISPSVFKETVAANFRKSSTVHEN